MAKKHWLSYVVFYLLWTVLIALGFWFLILSREAFLTGAAYYAGDSFTRGWQTRFFDKVFFLSAGIAVLVFFYGTEGYLRAGIEKHDLLRRFFKAAGWMLLVIFVTDFILLALQQFAGGVWLRWVILAAELGLGVALSWAGRRKPAKSIEPPATMKSG
ncbi:MAG: hypothetical protein WHX52_15020 [Anaerolineae bacterium]